MRSTISILSLPTAVLLLWACASPAASEQLPWPYNLPRHMKYFPEDEAHVKRSLELQERLQKEKPIGVKKMSADEGEMFFLDNWIFAGDGDGGPLDTRDGNKRGETWLAQRSVDVGGYENITEHVAFSPLRPHAESLLNPPMRIAQRAQLAERDFKCPDGTQACTSIGAPDSCCGTTDTCINVQDTGFGSVGCCPRGQTCAGSISCDTRNGYSSCPGSPNGGCCLPGFSCQDVGCIIAGTSTVIIRPTPTPTSTRTTPTTTAVIVIPTSVSSSDSSSAPPSSSLSCNSGYFSCPASLGGGCCQNGLTCASGAACLGASSTSKPSTTGAAAAPARPTSAPSSGATTTTENWGTLCPTGFYACSAYYPSGCCRIGRDCQSTGTCILPTPSATIINTNGVTIIAPSGATVATTAAPQGGSCASGWYSCPANRGGNCCLNGFSCAEQCISTSGTATSVVGKIAPNSAATVFSQFSIWASILVGAAIGVGAVLL